MSYQTCETHRIKWNLDLSPQCALCKHGKPSSDFETELIKQRKYKEEPNVYVPKTIKIPCNTQNLDKFLKTLDWVSIKDRKKKNTIYKRSVIKTLIEKFGLNNSEIGRALKMDHSTIFYHRNFLKNGKQIQKIEGDDLKE